MAYIFALLVIISLPSYSLSRITNRDAITLKSTPLKRWSHLSDKPNNLRTQEFIQQLASERRPFIYTDFHGEIDWAVVGSLCGVDDGINEVSNTSGPLHKEGKEFILDSVRYSDDPNRKTFAIMIPSVPHNSIDTHARFSSVNGVDGSSSIAVIDPAQTVLNNVSSCDFFHDRSKNRYSTFDLRSSPSSLQKKAEFWPDFAINDDLGLEGEYPSPTTTTVPMLWLSSPGVTAQLHYDHSHNLFHQIYGKKTVLLLPPAMSRFTNNYPSVHQGRKMSQIDFGKYHSSEREQGLTSHLGENVTMIEGYEVVLNPGEILYIPPFWAHEISTWDESAALSLSVVSPSWEESLLGKAQWTPVPFKGLESKTQRKVGTQMLLVHLLSRVSPLGTPAIFSKFVYESRWSGLLGKRERRECFGDDEMDTVEQTREGIFNSQHEEYENTAKAIAEVINDELLLFGIKMTFMADYVEAISAYAVGVDNVGDFIYDCLDYDAIEIVEAAGDLHDVLDPLINDGSQDRKLNDEL